MSVQSSLKITPFLWFNDNVEDAVNFYTSIFPNTKILKTNRKGGSGPAQSIEFEIEGQRLYGFNGGPHFKFNEAISLMVYCETQEEIDEKYEKLIAGGGQESQCGWLKDKFGLSWQVAPSVLVDMLQGGDEVKAKRVMDVMIKMKKLDIAALKKAYDQE